MGFRRALLATLALPLVGCGGVAERSPIAGYDDCVNLSGVIYTVDGEVGYDDGTYPCSDFTSRTHGDSAKH